MSRYNSKKDTISEQQFNAHARSVSSSPEDDSPGDSEQGASEEMMFGLGYMPNENDEYEGIPDDPDRIRYSDEKKTRITKNRGQVDADKERLRETAQVVSSELPAPLKDFDAPTNTH
jgi:hypothetical protein